MHTVVKGPSAQGNRRWQNVSLLRACLHGGGGPQVGEVTRLAVVKKYNAFTCNPTTPGCWGKVS